MTTPLAASWGRLSAAMTPSYVSRDGRTRAWSMDPNGEQRGESWMPNTSAWPNDASVCSLSQVLTTGRIPPKYYLSGKACAGILRRAERRGKELPGQLRRALAAVAGSEQISTATGEPSPCALTPKAGGGRIDAESETFVSMTSPTLGKESFSPAKSSSGQMIDFCIAVAPTLRAGGNVTGGDRPPGTDVDTCETLVAIPLDLRNATRDPEKRDEQNRQGCGVGAVGEPAPTLTKEFVPGVAVGIHGDVAHTLNAHQAGSVQEDGTGHGVPIVTHSLRAEGHDPSEDGTGRGVPIIAWDEQINAHVDISGAVIRGGDGGRHAGVMTLAIRGRGDSTDLETRADGTANALLTPNGGRGGIGVGAVAYSIQAGATRENPESGPDGVGVQADVAYTIEARQEVEAVVYMAVRRLAPVECERLQGFPDNYTNIPGAADGPRYKALGNSMAVPCMAWIGRRIKEAYAND